MAKAKYVFKVYTELVNSEVVLDELQHAELIDMDRFSIEHYGYFELCNILAEKLKISQQEIKHISILYPRKNIEFSIVSNNKYLVSLLNEVTSQQKEIIKTNQYRELKDYLFAHLETKDYETFLNEIYTYKNKFSQLLQKYGNAYNQGMYSEEERINISNLRHEIEKKLSEYKNCRGLCICRQKSEEIRFSTKKRTNHNLTVASTIVAKPQFKLQPQKFETVEEKTDKYNLENEEFLDPEEYMMMQGDADSDVKKY